jgi:ABC-type transport system involved in multi-copper enzyme maturation permease subunit
MNRWRVLARFEFQLQSREFLSGIYVAVFFLLTFAFTSSHVLELVRDRGALPRNAPLVLAAAMAGVTAFGAVITTMIASTAVLRDVALRTESLLLTTRLTTREYLLGRFTGALGVMLLVYAAIPLGLAAGTVMPWAPARELVPFNASAYALPLVLLVLPNVLSVAAIFFAVGALARNFFAILLTGIGLVALWQLGLSLEASTAAPTLGALLDPFGNAALAHVTRGITGPARASAAMPMDALLLANRGLWLSVGAAALAITVRRFRFELAPAVRGATIGLAADGDADTTRRAAPIARAHAPAPTTANATTRTRPGYAERWGRQADAALRFTFVTTLREKGFIALAILAILNGAINAWSASAPSPDAEQDLVVRVIAANTRLFFILVATIWAGELVWRERDLRADGMLDALPTQSSATVLGKLVGIHGAQAVLVALLGLVAFVLPRLRGAAHAPTPWFTIGWCLLAMLPAVALLTQLSLAVHALVQHKVAGHVLLIAGWVTATAVGANGTQVAWLTITDTPWLVWTTTNGVGINWPAQAQEVAYTLVRGLLCYAVAVLAWSRGAPRPLGRRLAGTRARG